MATGQGVTESVVVDVDKSFVPDGPLSLDEHRQAEFAKIVQPGFGGQAAAVRDALPPEQDPPAPQASGVSQLTLQPGRAAPACVRWPPVALVATSS